MPVLNAKARSALPKSAFAGPDKSYPVPDKSHAANAKARATQAVDSGRMSKGTEGKIDAKANKVLSGMKHPKGKIANVKTDRGNFGFRKH